MERAISIYIFLFQDGIFLNLNGREPAIDNIFHNLMYTNCQNRVIQIALSLVKEKTCAQYNRKKNRLTLFSNFVFHNQQ